MTISFGSHFTLKQKADYYKATNYFEPKGNITDYLVYGGFNEGTSSIIAYDDNNDPNVEQYLHKVGVAFEKQPTRDYFISCYKHNFGYDDESAGVEADKTIKRHTTQS